MPKTVIKRRRRSRKAEVAPQFYYAYAGVTGAEDHEKVERAIAERGIQAEFWQSMTGLREYRIPASDIDKCLIVKNKPTVAGTHPTRRLPYLPGTSLGLYLYFKDSMYYLKDERSPWRPMQVQTTEETPRRRRRRAKA